MTELNTSNETREYEVEAIWDIVVYRRKSKSGYLPKLYYLVSWKKYSKKENTCKPTLIVQYLGKLINSFHNNYLDKPITISETIDKAPPMARPIVKPIAITIGFLKQKQKRLVNSLNK